MLASVFFAFSAVPEVEERAAMGSIIHQYVPPAADVFALETTENARIMCAMVRTETNRRTFSPPPAVATPQPCTPQASSSVGNFRDTSESVQVVEAAQPRVQTPVEEFSDFFPEGYKLALPELLHDRIRNAMTFLSDVGLKPEMLDGLYKKYRNMFLQNPSYLQVAAGAGDCQLRALVNCLLIKKLEQGKDLSILEERFIALCGFIAEFGETKRGKRTVLGCSVPEQVKKIESVGFPLLVHRKGKKPLNPLQPTGFLTHIKVLITVKTLLLVLGKQIFTLNENPYTELHNIHLPTLPHEVSCRLVLDKLQKCEIPRVVLVTHFWSDSRRENTPVPITASYSMISFSNNQDLDKIVVAFHFYTVNYPPAMREQFATEMKEEKNFERLLFDCARAVDAENLIDPAKRSKFGRELLILKLMDGRPYTSIFHIEANFMGEIMKQVSTNNASFGETLL